MEMGMKNKKEDYIRYFKTLGSRFTAGGDYNAKHTVWGSRFCATKERELLSAISQQNLSFFSSGSTIPSIQKNSDLIDFCISKGISKSFIQCTNSFDLLSDHSPVFIHLYKSLLYGPCKCFLSNKKLIGVS